jgi:serine/threonine protein kinase
MSAYDTPKPNTPFPMQELKILPLLKNGSIEIPKPRHTQTGLHMYDIFRSWRSTTGIKLLSGLLTYNPKKRWTADEALKSDYFTELVRTYLMV